MRLIWTFFMFFRESSRFYDIHYWRSNNAAKAHCQLLFSQRNGTGIKVTTMMPDNDEIWTRFSLSRCSSIASTVRGLRGRPALALYAMTMHRLSAELLSLRRKYDNSDRESINFLHLAIVSWTISLLFFEAN
jgi:hypothetical protein